MMGKNTIQSEVRECVDDWLRGRRVNQRRQEGENKRENMLEKILESALDCKESQPVNSKGDQSWVFIERTDDEAETPILWPSDAKS